MAIIRFLSTLSLRRATPCNGYCIQRSDYFYPRSPCGERPPKATYTIWAYIFLSTLSLRRATRRCIGFQWLTGISIHALLAESDVPNRNISTSYIRISIHALLAESDFQPQHRYYNPGYFYPRSPCGERPPRCRQHLRARRFLSTLSLRRATGRPSRIPWR